MVFNCSGVKVKGLVLSVPSWKTSWGFVGFSRRKTYWSCLGDFHVDVNVADEVRHERCVFGDICCMLHATLCCDLDGQHRFALCRYIKVYDLWY